MLRRRRSIASKVLADRSLTSLWFFGKLFEHDLAKSFHAVRCSGEIPLERGPIVVFANHPSWWDGELFVWLAATVFATKRCHAPIEATMLERYRFFRKLGGFPVVPGYKGAAVFLRTSQSVLSIDDGLLLINAEARFRDVRDRPLCIALGLAYLARRMPEVRFVPLAIECAFWNERRPNLLLRFGDAVAVDELRMKGHGALSIALAATMDALAADTASREGGRFRLLLSGKTAINPFYDGWRRVRALLQGRRFNAAHSADANVLKQ